MDHFFHAPSLQPHRHDFYMIFWVTEGAGVHFIDFRKYELMPGRVFFVQQGQVHQVEKYPDRAWVVLFEENYFRSFLNHNANQEQSGILDYFNDAPYVDLDHYTMESFEALALLLSGELRHYQKSRILEYYITIMLLQANRLHKQQQTRPHTGQSELVRQLKVLIEQHYREHKDHHFYCRALHADIRKLNKASTEALGKTVYELIRDRILIESKALLLTTGLSVKEISFNLGFADPSYFCRLFRKMTGYSPVEFRRDGFESSRCRTAEQHF
ncbi:AraC family transcriptional regulator [Pararcticibacter amylolyticus]|nr:helix-turn-helix domain-containing protein [Pararcticibacter amylolyticus]